MLYDYFCNKCKKEFEELVSYKDRDTIVCCGRKALRLFPSRIYTDKDRAYNFTSTVFNGKPIEVSSKGQYKKLMKQYGMADCSIKESVSVRPKDHVALNKPKRQALARKMAARMQKEGVSHAVPSFFNKVILKNKPVKKF